MLDVFHKTVTTIELEGGNIDKAKNVGFRAFNKNILTYEQNKLRLSAYYEYLLRQRLCVD